MERTNKHYSNVVGREVEEVSIYSDTFEPDTYIAIKIKDFGNGKTYTEEQSTYIVSTSDSNWFNGGRTISKSLWGNCCDGKDMGVRLDWYLWDGWKIDYCYIITKEEYNKIFHKERAVD